MNNCICKRKHNPYNGFPLGLTKDQLIEVMTWLNEEIQEKADVLKPNERFSLEIIGDRLELTYMESTSAIYIDIDSLFLTREEFKEKLQSVGVIPLIP